jgi:lysyl-tRNA synthetase class I
MTKQKTTIEDLLTKERKKELEHFRRTRVPRCQMCHKNYVKVNNWHMYTWKPNCEHLKGLRLSIG